jgi:hypothetical protein
VQYNLEKKLLSRNQYLTFKTRSNLGIKPLYKKTDFQTTKFAPSTTFSLPLYKPLVDWRLTFVVYGKSCGFQKISIIFDSAAI